ncbi:MAG: hypothetical protein ACYC8T_03600 [Myxococcaceae bacterium]
MKTILAAAVLSFAVMACGGGTESGTGSGGGGGSSSSQTCKENHACINGSCRCTEGPKKDSSCCDPDSTTCTTNKCDTYCKYCT